MSSDGHSIEWIIYLSALGASTLRVATPLIFASMGGILSERSGVINIALEGMMLVGAFTASSVAHSMHSEWWGALGGMLGGISIAAVYALFTLRYRADQIVAGTAINFLAAGVTPFLCKVLYDSSNSSPSLEMALRFQYAPILVALMVCLTLSLFFSKSSFGLWVSFAGEHPDALASAGISVQKVRWLSVLGSGAMAGLAGASLSLFLASSFTRNMTAGRGFMAIAALIFGKWKPIPTLIACLFFGLTDALQMRLQGVKIWNGQELPVQLIQVLPYLVTVGVLAGWMGKSRAPRSLGLPDRLG